MSRNSHRSNSETTHSHTTDGTTTIVAGVLNEIVSKIHKSLEQQPSSFTNNDNNVRSIIKAEVLSLIGSSELSNADEATVIQLEQRIQQRLSENNTSKQPASLRALRRLHCQVAASSEWAQIDRYKAMLQAQQDRMKSLELQQQKDKAQKELKEQVALLLAQKQQQKEQKAAELQRINEDVSVWRQAEVAARETRRAAAKRLKDERQQQLDDLHRRQEIAHLLKRAIDAQLAEELCMEAKRAEEAEARAREQARKEFDLIRENNRAAERARKEARRAEQELEQKYMQQYAEMLARQDAQRQAQQEKIKAIQAAQAADAATRPSFKRWMDSELIERQAAAKDEEMRIQEAERAARAAAAATACHMEIATQLQERHRQHALELQAKTAELQAVNAAVAAAKADELKEMERLNIVSRRFKGDLDAQVSQNRAYVMMVAEESMNEDEERLNARILREMNKEAEALCGGGSGDGEKRASVGGKKKTRVANKPFKL